MRGDDGLGESPRRDRQLSRREERGRLAGEVGIVAPRAAGDRNELKAGLVVEPLRDPHEAGQFLTAWRAPRAPEVEERHLTGERGHRDYRVVERHDRQGAHHAALGGVRWSRYPTADRRQGEREDRGEKRTAGYHR